MRAPSKVECDGTLHDAAIFALKKEDEDVTVIDFSELRGRYAAVDFGASNTDLVTVIDGRLTVLTQTQQGMPSETSVRALLSSLGASIPEFGLIAVTGGHHRSLPDRLDGTHVVKVGELAAIARGGQVLAAGSMALPSHDLLVVSAGSGTAMVAARSHRYSHVTGTGVGGGSLIGLSRLILDETDPKAIDALALSGDANGTDLALHDVVGGPIGTLPNDATAVNFGRAARMQNRPKDEDLAAALVNMVGQVIATLAINAARAARVDHIVVTGHLTDMTSMRAVMTRVGEYFGLPLELHGRAGYATVMGALLCSLDR